jgi:hypothetical protein
VLLRDKAGNCVGLGEHLAVHLEHGDLAKRRLWNERTAFNIIRLPAPHISITVHEILFMI